MDEYTKQFIATMASMAFVGMPIYVGRIIGSDEGLKHPFIGAFCIIGTFIAWAVMYYLILGLVW